MILFTTNMFQRCSSTRRVETKNQIQLRYICSMYMLQIVMCHQLRDSGIAIHWASAWRGKFCQLSHFFGFCVLAAARQLDAKSLDEVHQVFCQLDTEQNAGKMLGNIGVKPILEKNIRLGHGIYDQHWPTGPWDHSHPSFGIPHGWYTIILRPIWKANWSHAFGFQPGKKNEGPRQ